MPVLNSRYVVSHYVFMPHLLIGTRERERESETVSMIIKTKPNQSRLHQKHQKVFLMLSLVMKLSNLNILHVLYIISFLTSIQCTIVRCWPQFLHQFRLRMSVLRLSVGAHPLQPFHKTEI